MRDFYVSYATNEKLQCLHKLVGVIIELFLKTDRETY